MYTTGDKQLIKEINKSSILQVIQEKGAISRAEISKILGLTPATISNNISELAAEGIVRESGVGTSNGGRKPILLQINEDGMFFIGVNIRKNGVEAAVVNLSGKIVTREERLFKDPLGAFEEDVLLAISQVRKKLDGTKKLYGIGIGMHGIVDTKRNVSVFVPAMSRRNLELKSYVEKAEGLPVFIDNDANAMAMGESYFGQAKGAQNYFFLNVGRGIGAGLVLNGELYRGNSFAAGEIGHIRVAENGRKCVCGKYGCLDTVATEYSILRDVTELIQTGTPSVVTGLLGGELQNLSLETIQQAANLSDACVLGALRQMGKYIGVAVSYVVNILNPEMVILGGSMSIVGKYLLDSVIESATALSLKESSDGVRITLSSLGQDVGVIGAASLVIQNTLKKW